MRHLLETELSAVYGGKGGGRSVAQREAHPPQGRSVEQRAAHPPQNSKPKAPHAPDDSLDG